MLVLERRIDEVIVIGDDNAALVPMTRDQIHALRELLDNTPVATLTALGLTGFAGSLHDAPVNPIRVSIVDVRNGPRVRMGVTAPKVIQVHREEVYDAIRKENLAAQNAASTIPLVLSQMETPREGGGEAKRG